MRIKLKIAKFCLYFINMNRYEFLFTSEIVRFVKFISEYKIILESESQTIL